MEMEPIVIKLEESRNAKVFSNSDKNLIHSDEFKKATDWIDKRIEDASKRRKDEKKLSKDEIERTKERLHDTITILGSRGSGKTSFLYSLLGHYKNNNTVEVIEIIDPTLIEDKGHVFLTIISQIENTVEKVLSKSDCNPESESYRKKKVWRDKLKSLAAGLPSIDGIGGNYDSWQDPEFIMDKGLRSVRAAKNLESDFHELIKLGLDILDKEIFVIALDDIDIDFRKGLPVLETIRKYLTSPYIITLLSGDLKLFSKAIRKQQWKNFGKALLVNEGDKLGRIGDYDDLVTEMEGQYLQKVMQPQRRIHLTTIQEKISIQRKDDINIFIESKSNPYNRIDKYYDFILEKLGIKNIYQVEAYRSFLLGLPIRTQIQFLSEFDVSSISQLNLTDAFLSDLYEKRIDIDTAKTNIKYLDIIILKLLLQEQWLEEAYQLQPTTTDISLNSSLTALSFLFSQKSTNNPYLIFDYFIRIGYVRNLSSVLSYQKDNASGLNPSIEGLCKHSSLFFDRVYRDILGSMTAYIRAFLNIEKENTTSWGGTIPIYAPSESAKGKGRLNMRIDYVFKNEPLYKRQIAFMPVSISQPNDKQSSFTTYSIYLLLATIGEVIKQYRENADLDKTLGELSQIRSYGMPAFKYYSVSDEQDEDERTKVIETKKIDTDTYSLVNAIISWIDSYPIDLVISPHVLGKISTRMFYAMRNLENAELVNNLGDSMHNRIIILLNTILTEEARELVNDKALSNNNPKDSIKTFKNNVSKCTKGDFENLKLFIWFFSCPLLLQYLDNKDEDLLNIVDHVNSGANKIDKNILDRSIYPKLQEVEILMAVRDSGYFYYGGNNIKKTVTILKDNGIEYDYFMKRDKSEVFAKCSGLFSNSDDFKKYLEKARVQIIKKKLKW